MLKVFFINYQLSNVRIYQTTHKHFINFYILETFKNVLDHFFIKYLIVYRGSRG